MSVMDCIRAAVKEGRISEAGAEEYATRMKDAEAVAAQRGLQGANAYIFAASEAATRMEKRAVGKRAQVQQSILAVDRAFEDAQQHSRGLYRGLQAKLGTNVRGGGVGLRFSDHQGAVYGDLQRRLTGLLDAIQSKYAGLKRDIATPLHTVDELFGKDSGIPAAKGHAEAWTKTMDYALKTLREAGIPIGRLEDWRVFQKFDALTVRAEGREKFVESYRAWMADPKDAVRLRDWRGDGEAYLELGRDDDRINEILGNSFDHITRSGESDIEPGTARQTTLADKYGRRRVFEYTTADAYHRFNRAFGVGDNGLGDAMVAYLHKLSKDIAAAQIFGPDPDGAAKILVDMFRREEDSPLKAHLLESTYFQASGKGSTPVSQRLALAGQTVRSWLGAVQLSGAMLSSTGDLATLKATAAWRGLPQSKLAAEIVRQLNPADPSHRAIARRAALVQEVGLRSAADGTRDVMADVYARKGSGTSIDTALTGAAKLAGRSVDFVIRAQGLAAWTQSARDALGIVFQGHMGDISHLPFDELAAIDKRTLRDYAFTPAEWDMLRTKGLERREGDTFLNPVDIMENGSPEERQAAYKFLGMLHAEQRYGIVEGNAVTRAAWFGTSQPGTWSGEALRSMSQYRGYMSALTLMHGGRALDSLTDKTGQWFRGQYIVGMATMLTAGGALTMQLKAIARGEDPLPTDNAKFWRDAFITGGAMGIVGDYLKGFIQMQQSADIARALSPSTGALGLDIGQLLIGNSAQKIAGVKTNFGREAVGFGKKYLLPEVFYTKTAVDRLFWDALQKQADPDYSGAFYRTQQRARQQEGATWWWAPGQSASWPQGGRALPQRGPDLSRAKIDNLVSGNVKASPQ